MGLRWNPFALSEHNTFVWPRIAFHVTHVLLGLPIALLARWLDLPMGYAMILAALAAMIIKAIWLDFGTPLRRRWLPRVVWSGFDLVTVDDWGDALADLGFTLIGALLPPLWLGIPLYYVLSLGSDP